MLSKELIKKIKQIEIRTNRMVDHIFSGEYHSAFKGNGMEFEEIREYYPGDDVRNIDWNVTARQNKPFIKKFREERELNLFLIIDMSKSNLYGEKLNIITEIAATIAFSAVKNNDKVGCLIFTDKVEKCIVSKKGKKHVLSIIETILTFEPENRGTNIEEALKFFNDFEKKKSIVFLISDYLDNNFEQQIKRTASKHDFILVRIKERGEEKIPKGAIFLFEDYETGEVITIDNRKKELKLARDIRIPSRNLIEIYTDEDYSKILMRFFKRRIKK